MIWGIDNINPKDMDAASRAASPYLMTFNEPDLASQANMTVDMALESWPKLENLGKLLGSPAVATDYNTFDDQGWLSTFMRGARKKGYRIDFLCVHRYIDSWNTVDEAIQILQNFLERVYDKYQLPIWLTEFSLIRWRAAGVYEAEYPPLEIQKEFASRVQAMLTTLPYVQRYAWFEAYPYLKTPEENTHLFGLNGTPTEVGLAYHF